MHRLYGELPIKKQTSTATSMVEAEINSMAVSLVKASWMRDILTELIEPSDLVLIHNNQAYIANLNWSPYKP